MKKFLAILMLLGAFTAYNPSSVNASWWYDFTHSDDEYYDDSYLWEDDEEEQKDYYDDDDEGQY